MNSWRFFKHVKIYKLATCIPFVHTHIRLNFCYGNLKSHQSEGRLKLLFLPSLLAESYGIRCVTRDTSSVSETNGNIFLFMVGKIMNMNL
jgi:hypothetical protein